MIENCDCHRKVAITKEVRAGTCGPVTHNGCAYGGQTVPPVRIMIARPISPSSRAHHLVRHANAEAVAIAMGIKIIATLYRNANMHRCS